MPDCAKDVFAENRRIDDYESVFPLMCLVIASLPEEALWIPMHQSRVANVDMSERSKGKAACRAMLDSKVILAIALLRTLLLSSVSRKLVIYRHSPTRMTHVPLHGAHGRSPLYVKQKISNFMHTYETNDAA